MEQQMELQMEQLMELVQIQQHQQNMVIFYLWVLSFYKCEKILKNNISFNYIHFFLLSSGRVAYFINNLPFYFIYPGVLC